MPLQAKWESLPTSLAWLCCMKLECSAVIRLVLGTARRSCQPQPGEDSVNDSWSTRTSNVEPNQCLAIPLEVMTACITVVVGNILGIHCNSALSVLRKCCHTVCALSLNLTVPQCTVVFCIALCVLHCLNCVLYSTTVPSSAL